jgi:hypothetical protein
MKIIKGSLVLVSCPSKAPHKFTFFIQSTLPIKWVVLSYVGKLCKLSCPASAFTTLQVCEKNKDALGSSNQKFSPIFIMDFNNFIGVFLRLRALSFSLFVWLSLAKSRAKEHAGEKEKL